MPTLTRTVASNSVDAHQLHVELNAAQAQTLSPCSSVAVRPGQSDDSVEMIFDSSPDANEVDIVIAAHTGLGIDEHEWSLADRATAAREHQVGPCSLDQNGHSHAPYFGPDALIEEITGVINESIAMVDSATLTVSINSTPVTGGALVFNDNYSPGDTVVVTPTANNVVTDGDMLHVSQSGLNALAGTATLFFKLRSAP